MVNFPVSKWIHKWGIDKLNAIFIDNFIKSKKPKIIIETGTFEAQATYVMAQAANSNNNNCIIYTIDYDGDPTSNLDIEKWLSLKKIRDENLKLIEEKFQNVKVIFLDGDSRKILPKLFQTYNIPQVDLFYQDSMHFFEGIQEEWNLIKPYIQRNSYVIFDDLKLKGVQKFRNWFKKEYGTQYIYFENNEGHKQFIVKKN